MDDPTLLPLVSWKRKALICSLLASMVYLQHGWFQAINDLIISQQKFWKSNSWLPRAGMSHSSTPLVLPQLERAAPTSRLSCTHTKLDCLHAKYVACISLFGFWMRRYYNFFSFFNSTPAAIQNLFEVLSELCQEFSLAKCSYSTCTHSALHMNFHFFCHRVKKTFAFSFLSFWPLDPHIPLVEKPNMYLMNCLEGSLLYKAHKLKKITRDFSPFTWCERSPSAGSLNFSVQNLPGARKLGWLRLKSASGMLMDKKMSRFPLTPSAE